MIMGVNNREASSAMAWKQATLPSFEALKNISSLLSLVNESSFVKGFM
jgi:hypothetical protein